MISKLGNYFTDRIELLFRLRKATTPGKELRLLVGPFSNPHTYETDAKDFIDKILKIVKVRPNSRILDVGCGSGRLIFELHTRYPRSHFYGFDIISRLIVWAKNSSTTLKGKFNFKHLNVFNKLYNPNGDKLGRKVKFPYPNNYFNLIIVQSVFTHMKYNDVLNYLNQLNKVLSPDGKVIITFFLINKKSLLRIASQKADFNFLRKTRHEYINDVTYPEAAIAYDENVVIQMLNKSGFKLSDEGILYGKWFGNNGYVYQDLLVLQKQI